MKHFVLWKNWQNKPSDSCYFQEKSFFVLGFFNLPILRKALKSLTEVSVPSDWQQTSNQMCAWLHMCPLSKSHLYWPIPLPFWSSSSELSEKLSGNPQIKLKLTDLTGCIFMCRECLYPFCLTRTPWRRYCHGVHFVDSKRECREGNCPRPFQSRQQGLCLLCYPGARCWWSKIGRDRKKCYFNRKNRRLVQTRVRY